jgi:hypothetical protein
MIRNSGQARNADVVDWTEDYAGKDNNAFFASALAALKKAKVGNGGLMTIGLVGQRDLPGVTLRRAQAALRWDLRPSLWSHAFLVADKATGDDVADVPLREVTLHSRTGEFPEPAYNAVTIGRLGLYGKPDVDANVALLAIKMTEEQAAEVAARAIDDPNLDRQRYDFWETLGVWAGYLWASGVRPNPLREGFPIFSSAFVEYCFEAIRLDLSPGASERNSAPEHIWNGAVWWQDTFSEFDHPIVGYYCLRDPGCSLRDPEPRD